VIRMAYLIGACVILYFAVTSKRFGMAVLGVIALMAAALALFVYNDHQRSEESHRREAIKEQYARSAITEANLKIENVIVQPPTTTADWWLVKGVVTNNSTVPLAELDYVLTLSDCPGYYDKDKCRVVGEEGQAASANVPPGQTREFSTYAIDFKNLPTDLSYVCISQPCTPMRIFNQKLVAIRAATD
jgi:hypothetical protein